MNKQIALLSIVGSVLLAMLFTPGILAEELHRFGYNDASVTNGDQTYETSNRPETYRGRPAKRFQRLDSDHNGTLSENEVGRPRLFQRMDQNADSVVSLREFRTFQKNRRNAANNQLSANATSSFSNNRSEANAYNSNPTFYESEAGSSPRNTANQGPRNRRVSAESSTWQSSSYATGEAGRNRGNRTSRFQQLDKDGSGSLSQDELGQPRLFQRMDQNSDGLVTLREFRTFHRNRRQMTAPDSVDTDAPASARGRPTPSNLDNSTDAFPDIEQGDQAQDDDEAIDQSRSSGNPSRRFQILDVDKNGSLNQEEVGRAKQFQKMDSNADGKVTFTEFINFRNQRQPKTQDSINPDAATVSPTSPEIANAPQATTDPSAINKYMNIPYNQISGVDPNLLSLDIYAPKNDQQNPVLIMIHGGGWKGGDKANISLISEKAQFFTSIGYVFVSINYRLSPAVRHPAHVQDVATAISWIHSNINKYSGDSNNIFLMGHSAGAHLAALVTLDESYLKVLDKKTSIIKGVILLDGGGYDIPEIMKDRNQPKIFREAFGTDTNILNNASPIYHITEQQQLPPFLIFYTPRLGAVKQSQSFISTLRKFGKSVDAIMIKKTHEDINHDIGLKNDETTDRIIKFISELLPPRAVATHYKSSNSKELDQKIDPNTSKQTPTKATCFEPIPGELIKDPEFEDNNLLAAWQVDPILNAEGKPIVSGQVIIVPIDPNTGSFILNNKIIFNDANPIPLRYTSNGPEWGQDNKFPVLYFAQYHDNIGNHSQLAKITRQDNGKWSLRSLPNSIDKAAPFISSSSGTPYIYYMNTGNSLFNLGKRGSRKGHYWGWRIDNDNSKDHNASIGARHGRWIPGTHIVVYARSTFKDGLDGLYAYDADTNVETLIDSASKFKSFAVWRAPENQGEPMIVVQTLINPLASELRIYAYDSTIKIWRYYNTPPNINSGYPYPTSPEAFVVNNKSYIAVVSTRTPDIRSLGIVWITAIANTSFRRVISEDTLSVKKDPEALSIKGGKEGIIYYVDATQRKFKACYAGLN